MNKSIIDFSDKKHKKDLPYRPCVGIMLLNKQGKVFIGNRLQGKAGNDVVSADYTWQMPQGGIDEGEEALEAAYRELYEETNIRSVKALAQTPDWLTYDLPEGQIGIAFKGKYRGQKQKWFAMRFLGDDTEIDVQNPGGGSCKPEFSSWRWEDAPHLPGLIIPFKRKVYEQVISQFEVLTRF